MDEYDVHIATAPDPAFDWRDENVTVADLRKEVRLGGTPDAVLDVRRAIDDGTFPGRRLDWATSIACVTKAQARRFVERQRWTVTPIFEALPDDEPYYLIVTDTS